MLYSFLMNRKFSLLFLMLIAVALMMCKPKQPPKIARDETITPVNAVTKLYVDSLQMEKFITGQQLDDSAAVRLRNFYNSRNFQFAWLAENGLAEQARVFYEMDKRYMDEFRDSTLSDRQLSGRLNALMKKDTVIRQVSPSLENLELQLTQHFFNFVSYTYAGKVDPASLQWYIPRKKIDAIALLDSLVAKKGKKLEEWEPVNSYYKTLNAALVHWYKVGQQGRWDTIVPGKPRYKETDSGQIITVIKKRLAAYADYTPADTSSVFDADLVLAVKKAQQQFGLKQSGYIDISLIRALNVPIESRIRQLLINLERMRWVPAMPENKFILVNIPEYKLHVFEAKKEVLNMNIVVGKEANQTVIFSNTLKNIVFSPYWNIPPSIVRAEILPDMKRNKNYLAQKNMEQTGFSDGLPVIRQKPGNTNSLGRVKFLFPNVYNIYLHDTPAKTLFAEQNRAFSHGCIRLAAPKELAAYLLADRPEWTKAKMDQAMNSKKEVWVTLKQPVPVFITYFTAWVDKDGLINFRDDLYGHDLKMGKQLFK
jgi:murein L,D-transpeptidase YcbB/YkuD